MTPSSFEAPDLPELQQLLPAFQFEALIAQGGMGAVYKAQQISLDRDVAIKILPREFGSNAEFRQSFETEARAMARLNHPNLIGVYDSGTAKGLPYIVMEYIQGKSLFHSSHGKIIEAQQSVELIIDICRGLAHAHENGIIHRDIKPANILLTPKREPKIGDFGLAQHTETDDEGLAMGTPGYTAPELYEDPTSANERSDTFAVGVILYELLTGALPDAGRTPPSALVGTDPRLDEIWAKATDPDPDQGYSNIREMRRDLELWMDPAAAAEEFIHHAPATTTTGPNWSLMRNFVIIALLMAAIGATWKIYKSMQANRVVKQEEAQQPPPPPSVNPVVPPPEPSPPVPDPTPPIPPPVAEKQTPLDALTHLRADLLEGYRDEFPPTSIQSETAAYFFVPTNMTWPDARSFAENHGGNLALIQDTDALQWLTKHLPDSTTWLGATINSTDAWQQLDGTPWPLDTAPEGTEPFASLSSNGLATAESPSATRPFFIQWQLDGSNPCDLKTLLARTRESLESSSPVYPLGTLTANNSHYLLVTRDTAVPEARRLADSAGAHLMVPSNEAEADWLAAHLADNPPPGPILLGAHRNDLLWCWDTLEPWTFARWAENAPSGQGTALIIDTNGLWNDYSPDREASGFLLEWSTPPPAEESNSNLEDLRLRAAELITGLNENRQTELQKNTKTMLWDLESWLRSCTREEVRRFTPAVDTLKKSITKHRIPRFLLQSQERALPAKVVSLKKDANVKQDRIDNRFDLEAAKVRAAYLKRLADIIAEEKTRGQLDLAKNLESRLANAADLQRWIASLGILDAEGAPVFTAIEILAAKYGSRGRHADVTAKIKQFIEVDQKSFRVLASHLGVDPDPGWNKSVYISFAVDGQTFERRWGRNTLISPAVLLEHVASKTKPALP